MSWQSYRQSLIRYPHLDFSLDPSLMDLPGHFQAQMAEKIHKAFAELAALEAGAIANPDEDRMVGHAEGVGADQDRQPHPCVEQRHPTLLPSCRRIRNQSPTG